MKRIAAGILLIACLALTSCGLLPAEETFRSAPVIRDYQQEEYALYACSRGDIVLKKNLVCYYVPVRTENLSFPVSGVAFEGIYAAAGDSVKQGQLLAELKLDGADAQIEAAVRNLARLRLQLEYLDKTYEMDVSKVEVQKGAMDEADYYETLDALALQYETQKRALEDSVYVTELRRAACEERVAERRLYSPMDGAVTYVRNVGAGAASVAGEVLIIVVDSGLSIFRAETEYWDILQPGDLYTIVSRGTEYEARVTAAADLGLPEPERVEGKKSYVYFALTEPAFGLEGNDRGTLSMVLDQRENVLRVPTSAISVINGEPVVYYQSESGYKAYKKIETGLEADGMVEILSGLQEGEEVIVG